MKNLLTIFLLLFVGLCSCSDSKRKTVNGLVNEWLGREVMFPANMVFTTSCKDTVATFWPFYKDYSLLVYADSVGCLSCRLQLEKWKRLMADCDSVLGKRVPVLFYFGSNDIHEISHVLRKDNFVYPVCIDRNDSLNKLNHFPSDMAFQTFLLDRDNKVLALGNPIHNPKVKELYLKIIRGDEVRQGDKSKVIKTEVGIDNASLSLGRFDWHKEEKASFTLRNTGDKPLVIQDVVTSCGCTSVSYSPEPVLPGRDIALEVTYKAEHPEHFNKTITVYCNAVSSPIILKVSGDAVNIENTKRIELNINP